jgi:hypothetical protein
MSFFNLLHENLNPHLAPNMAFTMAVGITTAQDNRIIPTGIRIKASRIPHAIVSILHLLWRV